MRILLVDDEVGVTDDLVIYLEDGGHTVAVLNLVKSRDGLLKLLNEFKPEGISLDYRMTPSGDEIYRWIREWNVSIPVVFYSKYADSPVQRQRMIKAGSRGEDIISKREASGDVKVLLSRLRALVPE